MDKPSIVAFLPVPEFYQLVKERMIKMPHPLKRILLLFEQVRIMTKQSHHDVSKTDQLIIDLLIRGEGFCFFCICFLLVAKCLSFSLIGQGNRKCMYLALGVVLTNGRSEKHDGGAR